jgi:sulfite exporter TauE/SafE
MMAELLAVFLTGFLTTFHCIGMCGPLVLAYSLHLPKYVDYKPGMHNLLPVLHHLSYHIGRLTTYGLLGGTAGWLADRILALELIRRSQLNVLPAAGLVMIFMGLAIMGILPFPERYILGGFVVKKLGRGSISGLIKSAGVGKKLLLGLIMGFLPCMPLYAIIVRAMATASFLKGFAMMLAFGLGTMPGLLFLGIFASLAGIKTRIFSRWLMGLSIIFMGGMLLHKGIGLR